jgi:hypothetical protein
MEVTNDLIWKGRDGEYQLSKMTDTHLENALRISHRITKDNEDLADVLPPQKNGQYTYSVWVAIFKAEIQYRAKAKALAEQAEIDALAKDLRLMAMSTREKKKQANAILAKPNLSFDDLVEAEKLLA